MESAGRAAAHYIVESYLKTATPRVAIICGKGNNGGDGFVCARYLADHGSDVLVLLLASEADLSPDAKAHFEVLSHYQSQNPDAKLRIEARVNVSYLPDADLYIDALLGTGLRSALREPIHTLVSLLNHSHSPVVSLDVPTGLHADAGQPMGLAVKANETITLGAIKTGLLLGEGPEHAGKITCLDIGIPSYILNQEAFQPESAFQLELEDIRRQMPVRKAQTHKYDVGQTLVIAGSRD